MKQQHNSKKSILIVAGVIVLVLIVYFYFSGGKLTEDSGSLLEGQTANSVAVGTRVLNLLQQIRSLKIDTSLFQDKAYLNLLDYSVTIPEVPVGRPNPFAPLQGEGTILNNPAL